MGDDRAAPAVARRSLRADRRARRTPERRRTGSTSPRAATASRSTSRSWCERASTTRSRRATPRPCPGRCPRCCTSRSWPGSTPRRRRCRSPPPRPPPVRRSSARSSRRRCRSPPTSWTRRSVALVDARVLEPVDGRSARYQFRHELLREVAYELQPPSWRRKVHGRLCDVLSRDEAERLARSSRRTSSARNVITRRRSRTSTRRSGLDGAVRSMRLGPTSPGPSISSWRQTDDATRDHREVELRLRRGFLAMSTEGAASADASADFDRCLELAAADPRGDDMFSTLISLWAHYLSRAELEPRPRGLRDAARRTRRRARRTSGPRTSPGSGCSTGSRADFSSAVDSALGVRRRPRRRRRAGRRRRRLVRAQRSDGGHARAPRAGAVHGRRRGGGRREPRRGRAPSAAPLDFPQGPWSAAYASWLGSWMWIEAGRLDLAEEAARRPPLVERAARVRQLGADRGDADRGARGDPGAAVRYAGRGRAGGARGRGRRPSSRSGRCSSCGCSSPST